MEFETSIDENDKTYTVHLLVRSNEDKALLTSLEGHTCTLEYNNWRGKLTFQLRPESEENGRAYQEVAREADEDAKQVIEESPLRQREENCPPFPGKHYKEELWRQRRSQRVKNQKR